MLDICLDMLRSQVEDSEHPHGAQQGRVPTCENTLYSSPCSPPPTSVSSSGPHDFAGKSEQEGVGASLAGRKVGTQDNWRDGEGPPSPAINRAMSPPEPLKVPAACAPDAGSKTKASMILSPPEIYREIARTGEDGCHQMNYRVMAMARTESQTLVHACPARQLQECCKSSNFLPDFKMHLSTLI
eukprot:1132914-Pelagomonas_calceolata.AAC.6